MFKRCLVISTALILLLSAAACSAAAPSSLESQLVSDIMLSTDSVEEPSLAPVPDPIPSDEQQTEALAEEKDYLQTQIDALNQKIADLQWLRDSYVAENPADLQTKLAQCDALIASATAERQALQDRLEGHNSNASDENASETPSDVISENSQTPTDTAPSPSETVSDSVQPPPEESAQAS